MEARQLLAGAPMLDAGVLIQDGLFDLWVFQDAAPAVGDWNGDSRKDLVVGQYSLGNVELYLNAGGATPTFSTGTMLMAAGQLVTTTYNLYMGSSPQIVDWNNDRRPDLLTGEANGNIRVYLGGATGLAASTYVQLGAIDYMVIGSYSKPDVIDWNNDAKKDLIVGDGFGSVYLLLNTGTDANPVFTSQEQLMLGTDPLGVAAFGGMASPVASDWNGDGKKDLLGGAANGQIYYFENTGTDASPAFSIPAQPLAAGGDWLTVGSNARPEVVDWDGDKVLDLIVGDSIGYVHYFRGQVPPVLTLSDATIVEGDTGSSIVVVTATLSKTFNQPITAHYLTADGTATRADNDYLKGEGRLLIPPGQRTGQIELLVVGDTVIEPDETFYVDLSQSLGVLFANTRATITITNADQPFLTMTDVTLPEGDSGTTNFDFVLTLSQATDKPVDVMYATVDSTATQANNDYKSATGKITILAGQTTGTITVQVNCDTKVEQDEAFALMLTGATNATVRDPVTFISAYGMGTIQNDDELSLSIDDVVKDEGNTATTDLVFTVTLSEAMLQPVTVQYTTADATTKAPEDYTAATGTLTIPAGQATATITVKANGDTTFEADETFNVILSGASGAFIADDTGVGTIKNDDIQQPAPQIKVAVSWPRTAKIGIVNQQKAAIDFGIAAVGAKPLGRIFSVVNTGNADLQLSKLRLPRGYKLIEGLSSTLTPGKSDTFAVQVPATKTWIYKGSISFATNAAGSELFYFPVTGQIAAKSPAKKAAKKAAGAAPKADPAQLQAATAFSTSGKLIRANDWLSEEKELV